VAWQIDAYRFEIPVMAAPMDSVMSPATAIALGRSGGVGVLDLEGLWTRYDDPEPLLADVARLRGQDATRRLQEIYAEPVKADLITARLQEMRQAGVTVAGALSPQRTRKFAKAVVDAGVDLFVIRGTTVSAEHVSGNSEPLNLKEFIYELDVPVIVGGCATHQAALHLMRTGAAGVLVGFGGGAAPHDATVLGVSVPMATAVADVGGRPPRLPRRVRWPLRARHRRRLDRSQRRPGQGLCLRSRRGDGRLAVRRASEAPGRGFHWGAEVWHPELPRGERVEIGTVGSLEQVLFGPSVMADGTMNLIGALRRAMATTGYTDLKEFQRVEIVVS
jgi:IMP dehydrogenase